MGTNTENSQVTVLKPSVIAVGILFSAFLILSNLSAFKLVQYSEFSFPAALIFVPVIYIFDDILTEVYGFKISRLIIWMALLANVIVIFGTFLTVYLQPSPYWQHQKAYATIYQAVPRVFIASVLGYLSGEFFNSVILAKLKIYHAGRKLWLRLISSTMIGVAIDTTIFVHIAFLNLIPYVKIWQIIIAMYSFKMIYELLAMPITYKVINYLKRKDNIDYYDVNTSFNPFSVRLDD